VASADVYLNIEQLKNEVIALNDKKLAEISQAMRSANDTVRRLALYGWEGKSKDAFVESFAKYQGDIAAFSEYIRHFNKQLKTIHSNAKKLQSQGKSISTVL